MITVPEAAKRAGKDPETIRRWIRSGRLRARKIGTQHVIEDQDLEEVIDVTRVPVPPEWGWDRQPDGRPMPDFVHAVHEARGSR